MMPRVLSLSISDLAETQQRAVVAISNGGSARVIDGAIEQRRVERAAAAVAAAVEFELIAQARRVRHGGARRLRLLAPSARRRRRAAQRSKLGARTDDDLGDDRSHARRLRASL